ncbi:MAG: hypothetical protein WA465_06905 [Methylovirgula sp.]
MVQLGGGVTTEVDHTKIQLPGTYGGTITRPGPSYNAAYLRIRVRTVSYLPVNRCQAFISSLEKQSDPDQVFIYVDLPHPIPLQAEPFEVLPNIPRMIDFMKTSSKDSKFVRTGGWPNALARSFDEPATYRFTIAVTAMG